MAVVWNEQAATDRDRIFDFILKDSPQNALLVDDRIGEQVQALANFPELGRKSRRKGTREFVIRDTPYIAIYRVVDADVEILRVLDGRRRRSRYL